MSKVEQVVSDAFETLKQSADLLFAANHADAQSYSLRRVAAWQGIKKLPAIQGGSFTFPGGGGMAKQMEALQEAEDWNGLLELAEPLVSQQKLWLEPSYFAAQALMNLGPRYQAALEATTSHMVAHVMRHPALLETNFSNGYAVASGACRIWLNSHMSKGGGGASDDPSDPAGALEEARGLLLQGGLADAVRKLEAGLAEQRSRRGRFRWALAVAQLCLDGDKAELASFRLRSLESELEQYGLVEWEPQLAVTYLGLGYRCARAQGDSGAAEAQKIYERLCRVDMAAALELDG
ncbi:MAG: type VI secretion system domain-containing protein [Planctomycetota bacterium]